MRALLSCVLQDPAKRTAGFSLGTASAQLAAWGISTAGPLLDAGVAGRLLWPGQEVTLPHIKVS